METIKSYAKINTYLSIIGKKPNGYHNLDMIMVELELHDLITFSESKKHQDTLECNIESIPTNSQNTIIRAINILRSKAGLKGYYDVELEKLTPTEAGMGTGSSNAAATLKYLNEYENLGLSDDELIEFAHKVGSDVPYFIHGKTAVVKGEGEIVRPINDFPECFIILVKPVEGLSTKEVFANVTNYSCDSSLNHERAIANGNIRDVLETMKNDFDHIAKHMSDEICEIEEQLNELAATKVMLTGSGPTVVGVFVNELDAQNAYKKLKDTKYQIYMTTPKK